MRTKFASSGTVTAPMWKAVASIVLTLFVAATLMAVLPAASSFAKVKKQSNTVTLPAKKSRTVTQPGTKSRTVTQPGTKSRTVTRSATKSRTVTLPAAKSRTVTQPATKSRTVSQSRQLGANPARLGTAGQPQQFGAKSTKPNPANPTGLGIPAQYKQRGINRANPTGLGIAAQNNKKNGVNPANPSGIGIAGQSNKFLQGAPGFNPQRAGAAAAVPPPSDIRLKRDIVALGRLDNGLTIYRFRYKWDDQAYVGVMAQDVRKVAPDAVLRGSDGYLRVNYDQLGLRMQTWEQWSGGNRGASE